MPDDRIARLAHRWKLIRRARGIDKIRRRVAKTLAGLGKARTVEWADLSTVSSNGTTIRQRLKASALEQARIANGEWSPRRELLIGGWR